MTRRLTALMILVFGIAAGALLATAVPSLIGAGRATSAIGNTSPMTVAPGAVAAVPEPQALVTASPALPPDGTPPPLATAAPDSANAVADDAYPNGVAAD